MTTKAVSDPDLVTATIDGIEVHVPKGTLVIRAAEQMGIEIPRFCDHSLLDPVAACRQCIVEVPDAGNGRPMKPQPACALTVMPNMVVETGQTNEKVAKHQAGMLEFLLINHPLDCPICDKGGECPLQNQAMSHGREESRYEGVKRTYPKPVNISAQILIDRERCVLCQRCTRFGSQISGDDFISLAERGALSQISIYADQPYESYFSGNIIQICPVGALTSIDYRFQARPFDLVSTATTCEHCASGCELRTDHRHFQVKRRLAGEDAEVNEEWSCDKGRFAFRSARGEDRLTHPLVRRDGVLQAASWPEAIDAAVAGLQAAGSDVGVLTGGRLTLENAYAYSRFARGVLQTNNIDFRSRPYGADEEKFLAAHVAMRTVEHGVTYGDIEKAKKVILVAFEPEDESPIVFLRLRKAWRKMGTKIVTIAPFASRGSKKMSAEWIPCRPGDEIEVLKSLADTIDSETIIMAGERAGLIEGLLSTVVEIARSHSAQWTWVPRRAGERAALDAGCLPTLLPGGRPLIDPAARVDLAAAWSYDSLPEQPGMDLEAMIEAAKTGELKAMVIAGATLDDIYDGSRLAEAMDRDDLFVVSLEQRHSDVTAHADVVFPVALLEEQLGTFINWEGRERHVRQVNTNAASAMSDVRVLAALADAMGSDLGFRTPATARADYDQIADWNGSKPHYNPEILPHKSETGLIASTWRLAIDNARCIDGAEGLRLTSPKPFAAISRTTADAIGISDGEAVRISSDEGSCEIPVKVITDMVDSVVWMPMNSGESTLQRLQTISGQPIHLRAVTVNGGAE